MTIPKPCLKDYPTKRDFKCLWVKTIFKNRYMLYINHLWFCNFNKRVQVNNVFSTCVFIWALIQIKFCSSSFMFLLCVIFG